MPIEKLRSGSIGISDTLERANHHAQALLPMIHAIVPILEDKSRAGTWLQGNIVHHVVTEDGRRYVFRGLRRNDKYIGITVNLQVSKGDERPQIQITDILQLGNFLIALKMLLKKTRPYEYKYEPEFSRGSVASED